MKKLLLLAIFVFGLHAESFDSVKRQCEKNNARACTKIGVGYYKGKKINRN